MDVEQFQHLLNEDAEMLGVKLQQGQIQQFYDYMELLLKWNNKINLTAITEESEIIKKHFIDSLTVQKYIKNANRIIDVGTGAGFPGVPLKILNEKIEMTLLDSLNKRLIFLEEVITSLKLKNVKIQHDRAEDAGKNENFRATYDVAISRAVAPLNVLAEYLIPFTRIGGKAICMKGSSIDEEVNEAQNAIKELGGKIIEVEKFVLPHTNMERTIIVIQKVKNTPEKYPRKAGMPTKQPIL